MSHMFWIGIILGTILGVVVAIICACCVISHTISEEEEQLELREIIEGDDKCRNS